MPVAFGALGALAYGCAARPSDAPLATAPPADEYEISLDLSGGRGSHTESLRLPGDARVLLADDRALPLRAVEAGNILALEGDGAGLVLDVRRAPDAAASAPDAGARVVGLSRHTTTEIVRLRTGAAVAFETTPEHPFFVVGKGWTAAGALAPSDRIDALSKDGYATIVEVARETTAPRTVFNLLVEGSHTYRVGTEGLLVHNGGCFEWLKGATAGLRPGKAPNPYDLTDRWKASLPPDIRNTLPKEKMPSGGGEHITPPSVEQLRGTPPVLTPEEVSTATAWTRESTATRVLEAYPQLATKTWDEVKSDPALDAPLRTKLERTGLSDRDWDYYKAHIAQLHKLEANAPRAPGRVYRGLNAVPEAQIRQWVTMARTPGGAPFPMGINGHPGSSSATRSPEMAETFTHLKDGGNRVIMVIDQRSGVAIENAALAQFRDQKEVLLPYDARYALTKVTRGKDKLGDVVFLHLEEGPPRPQPSP